MRHAQGVVVMLSWDTSLEKKEAATANLIYSYRCALVSESEHLARLTTAYLHGCDGDICFATDGFMAAEV